MKKIFLILGLLSVIACQDETTDKTPQAPNVYQGVFLDGNNVVEVYVQEYQDNKIQNLKIFQISHTNTSMSFCRSVCSIMGSIFSQDPPAKPHPIRGICILACFSIAKAATFCRASLTAL